MTFFFSSIFMLLVFWRPQEWLVPALYGYPILDLVVGFSLLSMLVETNEGRLSVPRHQPQVYLLLGLWLAAPISHIPHTYFYGLTQSIMPVFKVCFFTYILIVVFNRTERLRISAIIFVAMGCFMAWDAIVQEQYGVGFSGAYAYQIPSIEGEPPYSRSVFFGIFADPNDLAQFLVTCIPFSFVLMKRKSVVSFLLACGVTALLFKGLLTTHSRGGQVGLVAATATQILLFFPQKWFMRLLVVGTLVGLALCPFAGGALDASAAERVVFWGLANQAFKHNPVFGLGYDMFWQVTTTSRAAHNAFVLCYTELGLLGYTFWFGLISTGMIGAWRVRVALNRTQNPEARWLWRMTGQIMASTVGFCGSAYFLSRTFVFPLFFLIAMLAATPDIANRFLPPDRPSIRWRKEEVRRLLLFGSVASMIYIYISIIFLNKALYG